MAGARPGPPLMGATGLSPAPERPHAPAPAAAPAPRTVLALPAGHRNGSPACRVLRAAGYRVLAAHEPGELAGRTRHADRRLAFPPPRHDRARFVAWLRETCRREAVDVILPLDEEIVQELLAADLGAVVVAGPTAEQYRLLCDKAVLGDTAARAGIDHPHSVEVTPAGPDGPWPSLPSIVKPVRSEPGSRGGRITAVATAEERAAAVAALVAATGAALVQERIDGRSLRIHFARAGGALTALLGDTVRRHPAVTGMASVSRYGTVPPRVLDAVMRVLETSGYEGTGSIQFLETDERLVLHDVNLRQPMSVAGTIGAGLDLPRHAVDIALGRARIAPVEVRDVRYVWFYAEARALLARLRGRPGEASVPVLVRDLLTAAVGSRGVLDPGPGDPLPWLASVRQVLVAPRRPGPAEPAKG